MPRTRLFEPSKLLVDETVRLNATGSHHLAKVLRASVGEEVTVFNGEGGEYTAVITLIDKKGVEVKIKDFLAREVESPVAIYLAQGIARGEKMDFIVQKAVELGVTKIFPLVTERCNVKLAGEREEKRLQHWQAVAVSACEQSGRNRLVEVAGALRLEDWLSEVKVDVGFVLSPHVKVRWPEEVREVKSVAVLIGPEGGLSEREVESAMAKGFQALNLGPRVLRTETATIAALAMLQTKLGDF